MRFAVAISLSVAVFAACGHSHDDNGFDTLQACFDEHHTEESLPTAQAIVICCLDHPIAGVAEVCGANAASCTTYVTANLTASSATSAEVTAACTDYETQKGM